MVKAKNNGKSSWGVVFSYLSPFKGLLTVICLMSLTSSAASLLQPLIVNDLVDSAGSAQGIGYLPVLIILVLIIGAILNGIQQYFIQKVAESVARDARTQLVRKILRIPLDALEKYTKGDILSRVINDTMLLRRCLTEGFVQSFVGVFTLIGAVIGCSSSTPCCSLFPPSYPCWRSCPSRWQPLRSKNPARKCSRRWVS